MFLKRARGLHFRPLGALRYARPSRLGLRLPQPHL